ncbi:MAG TPA: glutamate-5-semialdehyde dehydrogenase, partial [Firmicutes bacterium]|nr:glutamate-5-semialdehyde dehydrogenase [Bacillota bacterium]
MEQETLERQLRELGESARAAAQTVAKIPGPRRNQALLAMADGLAREEAAILAANAGDVREARERGLSSALLDRLTLNPTRLSGMVQSLREVAALPDPVGEIEHVIRRPNGLQVGRMRVPLGVVGMVYEARPNVTAEAAGLCLKAGNACVLRGGSEAFRSNSAIASVLQQALEEAGLPREAVQLVPTTDRAAVSILGRLERLIDVIIARGGESLMAGLAGATVPLFRHGKGVCHVYVDEDAELDQAEAIAINAKCSRPGVCNAMETLLVHAAVAPEFLPRVARKLEAAGVELRGCPEARRLVPGMKEATEDDWAAEYLALILSVRVVPDFAAALAHIARYGSGHSEAIVTRDYGKALRFLREVDAACVLVNASTRFNDGGELGLGAEIG